MSADKSALTKPCAEPSSPGGSTASISTRQLSTRSPARAASTCSTRVTWTGACPSVVRRRVSTTWSASAASRGAPGRSTRAKTAPLDGEAGTKRSRTLAPVRNPTPQTSTALPRIRCGRVLCLLTIVWSLVRGKSPAGILPAGRLIRPSSVAGRGGGLRGGVERLEDVYSDVQRADIVHRHQRAGLHLADDVLGAPVFQRRGGVVELQHHLVAARLRDAGDDGVDVHEQDLDLLFLLLADHLLRLDLVVLDGALQVLQLALDGLAPVGGRLAVLGFLGELLAVGLELVVVVLVRLDG